MKKATVKQNKTETSIPPPPPPPHAESFQSQPTLSEGERGLKMSDPPRLNTEALVQAWNF